MAMRRSGVAPGIGNSTATPMLTVIAPRGNAEIGIVERFDRGTRPLAMAVGIRLANAGQADDEFLAAVAAEQILAPPRVASELGCHHPQALIAGLVAMAIVEM